MSRTVEQIDIELTARGMGFWREVIAGKRKPRTIAEPDVRYYIKRLRQYDDLCKKLETMHPLADYTECNLATYSIRAIKEDFRQFATLRQLRIITRKHTIEVVVRPKYGSSSAARA